MHTDTRQYLITAALAALALVLAAPVTAGFMFALFVPFIVVSMIYNVITAVRKPEKRRLSLIRIVVWLVVPAIVGAAHWRWYLAARADANIAVTAVTTFKARTGTWPKTLQDAGIQDPQFGRRWMLGYLLDADRPFIAYASTFALFDSYTYDFEAQRWEFHAD